MSIEEVLAARDEYEARTGIRYTYGDYYGLFIANNAVIPQRSSSGRYTHRVVTGTARIGRRLPQEELEQVKAEYLSGNTISEIAEMHKTTGSTIRSKLKKMGVYDKFRDSSPAWSEEDDEQLRKLYFNGNSVPAIAGIMNRTYKAVSLRISQTGLPKLKKRMQKEKSLRNGNSESDKQNIT